MRIIHIALNYIDGWGYQENLLPLYQQTAGHKVTVVSDNQHYKYIHNDTLIEQINSRGNEYAYKGIKIYRIKTHFNTSISSFLCSGLYDILEREQPDMIFQHDLNTSTLSVAAKYKKRHPDVKLYVDNHADWINESKNRFWHLFFYEFLIPLQIKRLGDTVDNYIGVSPLRCKYLNKVFRVKDSKIKFLPIGCDTAEVDNITDSEEEIRTKYNIPINSFVVVSGGKLDRSKGTLELINACRDLIPREKMHLILFGKIDDEVKEKASQYKWITLLGWCNRRETLSLLKISDVACWPWLHTTLIEDSIAAGIPLVVKMSDNVSHFSKEKAGVFMVLGNSEEISKAIIEIKNNYDVYKGNVIKAKNKYSYKNLVKLLDDKIFVQLKS